MIRENIFGLTELDLSILLMIYFFVIKLLAFNQHSNQVYRSQIQEKAWGSGAAGSGSDTGCSALHFSASQPRILNMPTVTGMK